MNKKLGKDIVLVMISNGVKLLSSVLAMFVVPILFTEQGYGFYNLFLLYVSYVGVLHFGFIDGIYLKYGGTEYNEFKKEKFRGYTKFLVILETIMLLMVILMATISTGDRQVILYLVAVNLFGLNITSYFQFISQCTGRFKEFAVRNIIHTVLTVALIGIFYMSKNNNYLLYILGIVVINLILLIWYVFTYRDIIFGKSDKLIKIKKDILELFKLGIPLLLSNLVTVLISTIPKQFIEWQYPIEKYPDVFSTFSFAFTLLGFTSVFLTAISLVIYPTLRKTDNNLLGKIYNNLNSLIIVCMFLAITMYYPVEWVVLRFIPEYSNSLGIFFILCPGIALTSSISVIQHNYYKTLNKNKHFLLIGLVTTMIMISSIFIVYSYIGKEIINVAIITVVIQGVWYILTDFYLAKTLKINTIKNIIYIIFSTCIFLVIGQININKWIIMILYGMTILFFSFVYYLNDIKKIYYKAKRG